METGLNKIAVYPIAGVQRCVRQKAAKKKSKRAQYGNNLILENRTMRKKVMVGLLVLLVSSVGASCGTAGVPGVPNPVPGGSDTGASCNTRYWNEEFKVGFDVPAGMTGPIMDVAPGPADDRVLSLGWVWPWGGGTPDISIASLPSDNSLDEVVAGQVQATPPNAQIFKNEAITLDNDEQAWLIASTYTGEFGSFFEVQVILVRDGHIHFLLLFGDEYEGTNDYDYLLGIGRTLCAE